MTHAATDAKFRPADPTSPVSGELSARGPARSTVEGAPLERDELRKIHAYSRACNYLGANPHANGGLLKRPLRMPDFREYGITVEKPGQGAAENTRPLGVLLRDVMKANASNFRVCRNYAYEHGIDKPEIVGWRWPF